MRYSFAAFAVIALCVGCTHTEHHQAAVFAPASLSATTQPAPASAVYTVKYRSGHDDDFDVIDATRIYVPRGTALGFERTDAGVVATAGPVHYTLDVPVDATLKWSSKETRPTRFAASMQHFGRNAIRTAAAVGGTAAVVGGAILLGAAEMSDDSSCGCGH